jgi:hypothetical protein
MWLLILIALQTNPLYPKEVVLSVQPTKEACEEFKYHALKQAVIQYNLDYPLNFKLECKEMKP